MTTLHIEAEVDTFNDPDTKAQVAREVSAVLRRFGINAWAKVNPEPQASAQEVLDRVKATLDGSRYSVRPPSTVRVNEALNIIKNHEQE